MKTQSTPKSTSSKISSKQPKHSFSTTSSKAHPLSYYQKYAYTHFKSLYTLDNDFYNINIINQIICNDCSHMVAIFKDYLIYGDYSEFLQGTYPMEDSCDILPKIFDYYESCSVIFPNYIVLPESKYIYKNIQRKQRVIDNQQEQELEEERKKNKQLKKKGNYSNSNNSNINNSSDNDNKVFNTQACDSILNQTNTSNIRNIMGLPTLTSIKMSTKKNKQNELSSHNNSNTIHEDEMIYNFEKVVDMIEQAEFWSEMNKKKIVNCALRKKQNKGIPSNNNNNECVNTNNISKIKNKKHSKSKNKNNDNVPNKNQNTNNHSHVIRGRNYNRVNSININISSIIKMNSTSEKDMKLTTNKTMRVFSKGNSIGNNNKKDNKTINATSRHKHHKSQVVKKGAVNSLLSVNFDLIKKTFEEMAKKNSYVNPNTQRNKKNNNELNNNNTNFPKSHVRSSSHSRNPLHPTMVKISEKILNIPSMNVKSKRNSKYKTKDKEKINNKDLSNEKNKKEFTQNYNNYLNVPLTSRETQKMTFSPETISPSDTKVSNSKKINPNNNNNNNNTNGNNRTPSVNVSQKKTAAGSMNNNFQINDEINPLTSNSTNPQLNILSSTKSTTQSKPLTHRNKRNINSGIPLNNNFFSKTNIVHFNYNKPPPCNSNPNNKILQTFTHFKSASSQGKLNTNQNFSKNKKKSINNVVIPIRKDLNIKGIHIKGFDELLLKNYNSSLSSSTKNGGVISSERSEGNSNLKLSNSYALKSKTSRQRSGVNYLQGNSTYNVNYKILGDSNKEHYDIFKTTKH